MENDLTMTEMMNNQVLLQKRFEGIWEGDRPETAKSHLLYAVEEIGEVSAILKKLGPQAVINDKGVRREFCKEMADVIMYLCDVMQCVNIKPEEFAETYRSKVEYNLKRDFIAEHKEFLKDAKENK